MVFLEIVENQPEESTVLIVGHGGTLYWILNGTLELLPPKMDEWYGNCKLNIIERNAEDAPWQLTRFKNRTV